MTSAGIRARFRHWIQSRSRTGQDTSANGRVHPTAVLHPGSSLQPQGRGREKITVGAFSHVRGSLVLFGHGGEISIGDYCYVGEQTRLLSAARIEVRDRVLISHCVTIMDSLTHPIDPEQRHQQFREMITTGHPTDLDLDEKPVVIEEDVLIGCHSVVLRGVRIGRGAVVGAGSVVTGDVPPMTIVAGNPARIVKRIATAGTTLGVSR